MVITNVKQALLTKFNTDNKVKPAISLADVNWTTPEIWIQGQCNSRVNIVASANSENFGGVQTIYFNRRQIADDLKEVKIPGKSNDYTRLHEVLTVLREQLGVPVMNNEFLDKAISGETVTLNTTTSCMAYLPAGVVTLEYAGS